ncbi:sulfatase-like hydrolase/transferase [uncultured Lutibacter sp.]|uniref:sulfatase-like hydrolase/transferase n=2 Tax=Lutibacter TaxID=358023 RepID=UPI00345B7744
MTSNMITSFKIHNKLKNTKRILLFCLYIGSVNFIFSQNKIKTTDRPNIILIMADDLGWGDVGFNGNKIIKTPNLDQLANNGITFKRFYAAAPVCSPTRASCLTGRNPYRQGIYTANTGKLKKEEITLSEILKDEGYQTGIFGKWHLGTLTTKEKDANRGKPDNYKHYSTPDMHGFDEYFVTESKIPTFDPLVYPEIFDEKQGESWRYGWSAIENKKTKNYGTSYWTGKDEKALVKDIEGENTKIIMDKAIPFIAKAIKSNTPFFTVIWIHTPHLPVVTDKKNRDIYSKYTHQEQLYYGSITAMDTQIGRLYDFLKKQKAANNTMIWFASDNGPEVNTPATAGIYRGKKRDLYEGGLLVPSFCIWPQQIPSGKTTNIASVTSDYFPTILAMLNIKNKSTYPIDGIDLTNAIYGNQKERYSGIGFQYPDKMSWVNDTYKLIRNGKDKAFEMYHLINDPKEKNNIINKYPKIANQLKKELFDWVKSCEKSEKGADYHNPKTKN